jgi:hypothetical protein
LLAAIGLDDEARRMLKRGIVLASQETADPDTDATAPTSVRADLEAKLAALAD